MAKILTTLGEMDEELLERRALGNAVEYWFKGELVHRSVTVAMESVGAVSTTGLLTHSEVSAQGYRWTLDPPLPLRKPPSPDDQSGGQS